ncbi:MAG: response regulator transcription factor [Pseudomonadota bacterium]
MPRKTILVVDDDPKVRQLLTGCFKDDGFAVVEAGDATTTLAALNAHRPDLVTLDLYLGADNGLDLARRIKRLSDVPIVMVTGKGDVLDRVVGLEVGADDYITKPFHLREVLARVHAVLRRSSRREEGEAPSPDADRTAAFQGWRVRPERFEVVAPDGSPCELTTAEFNLLMVFLTHPKRILSREQIMDFLGGAAYAPLDRTIDNQVARLRKRIGDGEGGAGMIRTVRGVGYSFTADVAWS